MTREIIKEKFLKLKSIKKDIEDDFNFLDSKYQSLKQEEYQDRMLNAIHTYEELPNLSAEERFEYNEGEISYYRSCGFDEWDDEEENFLAVVDLLNTRLLKTHYAYLGAIQAYRRMKEFNRTEERVSGKELKYYS